MREQSQSAIAARPGLEVDIETLRATPSSMIVLGPGFSSENPAAHPTPFPDIETLRAARSALIDLGLPASGRAVELFAQGIIESERRAFRAAAIVAQIIR